MARTPLTHTLEARTIVRLEDLLLKLQTTQFRPQWLLDFLPGPTPVTAPKPSGRPPLPLPSIDKDGLTAEDYRFLYAMLPEQREYKAFGKWTVKPKAEEPSYTALHDHVHERASNDPRLRASIFRAATERQRDNRRRIKAAQARQLRADSATFAAPSPVPVSPPPPISQSRLVDALLNLALNTLEETNVAYVEGSTRTNVGESQIKLSRPRRRKEVAV